MRGFVFIVTGFNSMILLFFLNSVMSETRSPRVLSDEDPTTQPVFTSLQEVLDLLESEKFRNLLPVQQLLFAYFNICQSKRISYLPKPIRQPFIVVEGNHRTAKRMLAMRLSRRIGASLFHNPPRCLSSLRNFFPTGSLLLRAYFKLCAYALAQATRRLINIFPVILNGYWLEQQTYAIARTYGSDPPPADHPVYRWPNNLLKPDLIFFIEFPDNLHKEILTTRPPNAHKTLAMNALLKMNIPSLVVINTTRGHDVALQEMERHIIDRLGLTFPIRWLNTTRGPSRIHLRNIRVKKV